MADVRLTAACDFHARAMAAEEQAARYRAQRDRLIRQLRAEDPVHWSHRRLAMALRCSPDVIARVLRASGKVS